MTKHAYVEKPVWEPPGRGSGPVYGDAGRAGSPPVPYGQPPPPYHTSSQNALQQMMPQAPPQVAPGLAATGRPMSVLEQTEMRQVQPGQPPAAFFAAPGYGPPPSADGARTQMHHSHSGGQVARHIGHQRNSEVNHATLNDCQQGDWFIKWTKLDKPHLRWFWLDWKKQMLFWSNTQSAMMVMANNIRLEEVVSMKTEQQTEMMPEEPGRPRVYYCICIKTYKRRLDIATSDRAKFDKWYGVLDRLTRDTREANDRAYNQPHPAVRRALQGGPSAQQRQLAAASGSAAD